MVTAENAAPIDAELVRSLLAEESFCPVEPESLEQAGLNETLVESLLCKQLVVSGSLTGRALSKEICLPFGIIGRLLDKLRARKIVEHKMTAQLNDFFYALTEQGVAKGQKLLRECAYVGPAPVPLSEYVLSVDAQSIAHERPDRARLSKACSGISVDPQLFESLGPAITSSGGLFLYGAPGNGKSTLARQLTMCFGQQIWVPHAVVAGDQMIKFYDTQFHQLMERTGDGPLLTSDIDRRWVPIVRPTVIVGGELTLENLELRHHRESNVCEAPLQMKSNCGCLLVDDFGRQRIAPADLLNRWIVPLESRHDYLTLPTGKKIRVPFEQIVIFSTNLDPEDLVDEAFLRRIPYKIHAKDPTDDEFHHLFKMYSERFGCEYRKDVVNYLLDNHYRPFNRAKRRCHPRDLLSQINNYCQYNGLPVEMLPEYCDIVVHSYFAMVLKTRTNS